MKPLPNLETCTNGQIRQLIEAVAELQGWIRDLDLNRCIQAERFAELQSKVSEILEDSPLVILPVQPKRGPGRPRKDATA